MPDTVHKNRGSGLTDYWPLVSLIFITALAAYAITWNVNGEMAQWMHYFMGLFLCSFAMLKIFNIAAFADGFSMYDLIAKKNRAYAIIYPFIELTLGLGYLSFIEPQFVYTATILLTTVSAAGVVTALKKGLDINCPCMGSVLKVPLSTVTLTEDVAMGLMAGIMLLV